MSNDQRVHQTSKPGMAGPQISKNVSSACKTIDVALGKKEDVKTCRVVTGSLLGEGVEAVQEKYHEFWRRHIGPSVEQQMEMAQLLGFESLDALTDAALPNAIQLRADFRSEVFPHALSEQAALQRMKRLADSNVVQRSLIGMGYYGTYTPTVILRNILENPGWYTQYTPYQPEISQGRLEALLNYQTLVSDLTGLPIVNASLLDEGTAIAEAMTMCFGLRNKRGVEANVYFVAEDLHPQSIGVVATRAAAVGIEIEVGAVASFIPSEKYFGACFQYPNTEGGVYSLDDIVGRCKSHEVYTVVATDLLALVLLQSPGAFGVDVAVGSAQRFGVPLGFGGPHAAFMATRDEYKRSIPGRLVGVSKDSTGKRALRLSLQTREQHIRREKATSNICTAQVLLAIMAGMYAVYHGPQGLKQIALRIHGLASKLALGLVNAGCVLVSREFFDTITIRFSLPEQEQVRARAKRAGLLLRYFEDGRVGISLDECSTETEVEQLLQVCLGTDSFGGQDTELRATSGSLSFDKLSLSSNFCRTDEILRSAVFNLYHSETEFLRYVKRLESRDLSLAFSMIPLGSCTMKLNATTEMIPVTYDGIGGIHPFAPLDDTKGYREMFRQLEVALAEITGLPAVSLQPNAGSQGEYAGLLAIKRYQESRREGHRNVCLIPTSAHGTNPASAVMAGFQVVVVKCDERGNIDLEDLRSKASEHSEHLACIMVTYPSTHGVFESTITELCEIVHSHGAQVYLDGANLNALVGLARPGDFGADVLHINLHKTFCIPHGGGGPGMGPIAVAKHLAPFLPGHVLGSLGEDALTGAVCSAPWGSASILPISWMYMAMMGAPGLKRATQVAILNANYIAKRLEASYPVLYRGEHGLVAHECILDLRELKTIAGIEAADIAKRLMDYGFHAPTMSWPVPGTLMIEPTESESKEELDRFCNAMIAIREEVNSIVNGTWPKDNNPLKNAPHTQEVVIADTWNRPYSREVAAFPIPWTREAKFWPSVGRIDEGYGDKNLLCTCPPVEEYA